MTPCPPPHAWSVGSQLRPPPGDRERLWMPDGCFGIEFGWTIDPLKLGQLENPKMARKSGRSAPDIALGEEEGTQTDGV